jgi:diguanylate cyclase (GGDEF)-like protein
MLVQAAGSPWLATRPFETRRGGADIRGMVRRAVAVFEVPRVRLLVPFAFVTVFALGLAHFARSPGRLWEEQLAGGITVALIVVGFALPWQRMPGWTHPVVPLSYFLVIALMRDSHGGAASGYGPLCMLPVFWVALFGTRRHLALALVGVGLVFVMPVLAVGGEDYPTTEWRAALLWTLVLGIVGYRVQALVSDVKRRAALARERAQEVEQHAREAAETQNALQTIARFARDVSATTDPRHLICRTAVEVVGASLASLVEPAGRGGFEVTGSAGIPIAPEQLRTDVRPYASLRAFYSKQPLFVPDVRVHEGISDVIIAATGLRSIVYEPIIRNDTPVGILSVGWTEPRADLDERTANVVAYLAAEAGAAIERADLIAQLDVLANTDQLTGIPNRRFWDTHLPRTLETTGTRPLCVAVLDLDNFKEYNDRHGHQMGDKLLRDAATAWGAQLRAGDLLARYGGEEFAVLLPDTTLHEATAALARLRIATPTVTSSAGLAQYQPGETPDELVHRADHALYRAKHTGRNRLVAAPDDPTPDTAPAQQGQARRLC